VFAKLPLTALRAFESAGRLGGFKAAADELAVTPAAVSHQIKSLEEWLGALLFERTGQGVRLTAQGERLLAQVHSAFSDIAKGLLHFKPSTDQSSLTLSTTPAFASQWLIARLGQFHRLHPHIDVRIDTTNQVVDLARDSRIDLAIRVHYAPEPCLFCKPLLAEHFGAYACPQWRPPGEHDNVELINVPWISPTGTAVDWPTWCAMAGCQSWLARARLREYDDEQYALQAAIAGHGLVLASDVLVADSLASGALVPWRADIRLSAAQYSVMCVPGRERETPVREFIDWLGSQVGAAR